MNRLILLLVLPCLPAVGATVYKTVDKYGVASFSDVPPQADVPMETLVIDVPQPRLTESDQERLAALRETTDRMAADRRERERHRASLRQRTAQRQAQYVPVGVPYNQSPSFVGYTGSSSWKRRHRRSGFRLRLGDRPPRPGHPIARPPMRPPIQPPAHHRPVQPRQFSVNDYPASLVRRHYSPRVRQIFNR